MAIKIKNATFLHIPKTGGTWIRNYFKESNVHYEELGRTHSHCGELKETKDLIFCFIRHPLTWYRSYWECKQHIPDRGGGYLDEIVDLSFHEFIKDILQTQPGYLTGFYKGYTECCRFIGKQESLKKDLNSLLKYLRIPYNKSYLCERKKENVVPSDQRYTKELAFAIMKAEKEIIENYNYNYIPMEVIDV